MRTGKVSSLGGADVGGFLNVLGSQPGSVFVLPHYDSGAGKDTEITMTNSGLSSARIRLFFIDATGILAQNSYIDIAAGESQVVKASVIDPGNSGMVLGVVSNLTGSYISYNYIKATARFYMTDYDGIFPAFHFKALAEESGGSSLLNFDGLHLEPMPYDVGLFNVQADSFVAFAKLDGVLFQGLTSLTGTTLKVQGQGGTMSKNLVTADCQVSGVLSSIYPEFSAMLTGTSDGRLYANCGFGMIIRKTVPLTFTSGATMDSGTRVSGSVNYSLIGG